MTDPQPLKVITCLDPTGEREQCGALIENTLEARRIHRSWHAQDKKVKDAFRGALASRDEKIRVLELRLADMQRDVENIDIPEPTSPIEIDNAGWSDDDEPDDDGTTSTYALDDVGATITTDPSYKAADPADAISNLYTPRNSIGPA